MQERQKGQPRVLSMARPRVPIPCSPQSATGAQAAASDAASPFAYICSHCRSHRLPCVGAAPNAQLDVLSERSHVVCSCHTLSSCSPACLAMPCCCLFVRQEPLASFLARALLVRGKPLQKAARGARRAEGGTRTRQRRRVSNSATNAVPTPRCMREPPDKESPSRTAVTGHACSAILARPFLVCANKERHRAKPQRRAHGKTQKQIARAAVGPQASRS